MTKTVGSQIQPPKVVDTDNLNFCGKREQNQTCLFCRAKQKSYEVKI